MSTSSESQPGQEHVQKARRMAARLIETWPNVDEDEKISTVSEIVHQLSSAESAVTDAETIQDEWRRHNQSFSYEPPEQPPEHWESEDYDELFDRAISQRTDWVCKKCSQPLDTLRKARSHVRKQHQESLIDQAVAKAGYEDDESGDDNDGEPHSNDDSPDIQSRQENNSQLSEFEEDE